MVLDFINIRSVKIIVQIYVCILIYRKVVVNGEFGWTRSKYSGSELFRSKYPDI